MLAKVYQTGLITSSVHFAERQIIKMKKAFRIIALILSVLMCFTAIGCKNTKDTGSTENVISTITGEDDSLVIGDNTADGNAAGTETIGSGTTVTNKEVEISQGKVSMDKGLNLGGNTYTLAVDGNANFHSTSYNAMVSAFEKKFNCKIKKATVDFDTWNSQISRQMATGKSYDIIYFHGSKVPGCAIDGLCEDLTNSFTSADLAGSDVSKGGIDLDKTMNFTWNGKIYGVCSYLSVNPDVYYYNKALFTQYGLEDPRELYEQGKWTWDKIFEMGAKVTDKKSNQYFLAGHFVTQIVGSSVLAIEDGKVVERFSNPLYFKALQLFQKAWVGNNAIAEPWVNNVPVKDGFYNGTSFMYMEETSKWPEFAAEVVKSHAFNKTTDNLGIVPVPLTEDNKQKLYPCGWHTCVSAGKGSDPRVAIAWAKFESSFQSSIKDKYPLRDEDDKLIKMLRSGKVLSNRHGNYTSTSGNTTSYYEKIMSDIRNGEDIATAISNYRPAIINCIETTVGKGNYVSK